MKEYFQYVIPLGYNCTPTNSIRDGKFRFASYPFDWNYTSMEKIVECFTNEFKTFFLKENFKRARWYTGKPAYETSINSHLENEKAKIIYVHDGSYKELMNNDNIYLKNKVKYTRRIDRLLDAMNSGKKILFIRYENSNNDYQQLINIMELKDIIKSKYPKCNFKIYIFTNSENERLIGLDTEYYKFIRCVPQNFKGSQTPYRRFIEYYLRDNILYNNYYNMKKDYNE